MYALNSGSFSDYNGMNQNVKMYLKILEILQYFDVAFLTVLVLIKFTKFAVALRLRCGSCKLIFDIS